MLFAVTSNNNSGPVVTGLIIAAIVIIGLFVLFRFTTMSRRRK